MQLIAHHSLCANYKIQSFDPLIGVEVAVCVLPQTMLGDSDPFYDCGGADMPFLPPRLLPHLSPPPDLEVPHAHLKSIWECPKIIKSVWSLKMEKIRPDRDVDGANLATRCSRLPMQQSLSPCSESSKMRYPCMQRQYLRIIHDLVQRSVPMECVGYLGA